MFVKKHQIEKCLRRVKYKVIQELKEKKEQVNSYLFFFIFIPNILPIMEENNITK